jgi:translation initiation factor IF-2
LAKNLKINIKNTQLAAVLKKNTLSKSKEESDAACSKPEESLDIRDGEDGGLKSDKKQVRAKKLPSGMTLSPSEKPKIEEEEAEVLSPPILEKEPAPVETRVEITQTTTTSRVVATPPEKTPEKETAEEIAKKEEIALSAKKRNKKPDAAEAEAEVESEEEKSKKKGDKKKSTHPETVDSQKGKKGPTSFRRQAFSRVFDSRNAASRDDDSWQRRRHLKQKGKKAPEPIVRPSEVSVKLPVSVKDLAAIMKLKSSDVIQKLFFQGIPVTINDFLEDPTIVELIGVEFDCKVTIDTSKEDRLQITESSIQKEVSESKAEDLILRPPVVTIMGHVDHGKTSIIDSFRKSNLAAGEAGAITQHIGAFSCTTKHGGFTVLDTPGHEAFSAIRARGAHVTDIIVLVVAGDEGIKPQTEEAINKAQDANVPIIVAINKMDKPGFNQDEIYRQLADHNLLPEAWGGEIITVNCSAKTGEGIDHLAEMIALQSDVLELKANPNIRARGTVLESEMHRGLGSSATLLVQNGTLRIGDPIIFEYEYGRVKTMQDEFGKNVTEALPSSAVKITGLSGVPGAGNEFIVLGSEREARKIAEERKTTSAHTLLRKSRGKDIEHLMQQKVDRQQKKLLNIILKADVGGSMEAVKDMILAIPTDKVEINFISANVGQINESDIERAEASKALILGFHTSIESHAETLLKKKKVNILIENVIYHLVDKVKEHMLALLDKVRKEHQIGSAKVLATFKSSQLGIIAGCQVTDGVIKRSHHAKIFRNGEQVWEGSISSLKRHQDDAKEVKKDLECGIVFNGFKTAQAGDEVITYEITYERQEL